MRQSQRKLLLPLYQIYVWLIFVPLMLVLTIIGALTSVLLAVLFDARAGSRYGAAVWARVVGSLIPVLVQIEGAEHAQRGQSYVVVANHQSQVDILVLYGWLDLDLKWVMKKELRKIPFIGFGCAALGHVFVDRSNPQKARASINRALSHLGNGIGILFFPEGTRSPGNQMLPFKKGAFRVAIDQQMPLLPISLVGTSKIMPARRLVLFPGRVRMVIHPPIPTEGLGIDDLPQLVDKTRTRIQSGLQTRQADADRPA